MDDSDGSAPPPPPPRPVPVDPHEHVVEAAPKRLEEGFQVVTAGGTVSVILPVPARSAEKPEPVRDESGETE